MKAHEQLLAEGIRSRVVSMPSWDIFDHQPRSTGTACCLLRSPRPRRPSSRPPPSGGSATSERSGGTIGMKTFGASAPLKELQKRFGFEPERVVAVAKELLGKK